MFGKECHYATEAMQDLFTPEVAGRIYPLEAPARYVNTQENLLKTLAVKC